MGEREGGRELTSVPLYIAEREVGTDESRSG